MRRTSRHGPYQDDGKLVYIAKQGLTIITCYKDSNMVARRFPIATAMAVYGLVDEQRP